MKKNGLLFFVLTLYGLSGSCLLQAQDIHLRLQTRMGYQWDEVNHGKAQCDYLSLAIDGTINSEFSYSAFQHFNRFDKVTDDDPLAATDWLYLRWRRKNVEVSAGKQMIEYGGEEYDAAPIDLYATGVYWNHFVSFTYSANLAYWLGNTKLTFQVAELPWTTENKEMAYSLSWRGKLGWYALKHSLNLFGQGEGLPRLSSLVLGNIFTVGPARMYVDFINRWNGKSVRLLQDVSLVASATVRTFPWMNVRVKYNYDYNSRIYDLTCPIGTRQSGYLAAMELYPIKDNQQVRIHLTYQYQEMSRISAGFTWRIPVL